jgi:bacillithiol biosynthesis deacetylase BshB1
VARVLAIGPHPDDVEIGAGGMIMTLLAQGHDVAICDLTNGEPTPRGTPERRAAEAAAAARLLGISRRITLPLSNRMLADTVENRKVVAGVIREVRPDILVIPYWVDAHPDHLAACHLAEAARFYAKLTKTDIPGEPFYPRRVYHFLSTHYDLHVKPTFLFDISDYFERKLAAVAAYTSQFETDANGEMPILRYLRTVNAYWGHLISRPHAEAVVSREELGLRSLDGVV